MFVCRACLRRVSDGVSAHSLLPRNAKTSRYTLPALDTTPNPNPRQPSRQYTTTPVRTNAYEQITRPRWLQWAVRKELQYLRDPVDIAKRIETVLNKDDFDLAVGLAREASRRAKITVSWNHLIDYQLKKDRIHFAIKLYNEMKKRAQPPNSFTFTIIFRGCARSQHPQLALGEAFKLYQNMLSIERIKPNIIHLNAVLKVCGKLGDLDTMFSVLSSSDDPRRRPDTLTYTTILNAMRMRADKPPAGGDAGGRLGEEEIQKEKARTIRRAKDIWEEVISRWRAGSLIIDEALVCSMGRILLMGGYKDIDAIESLIEQTMMISRTDDDKALLAPKWTGNDNTALLAPKETESSALVPPRWDINTRRAPVTNVAQPGNNSLSLILEALEKTGKTTKVPKYWNVFRLHYRVVPDAENWTRAIRAFSRGKNSDRAATFLRTMPDHLRMPKHARIAMQACVRDNLNKWAFKKATSVMNVIGPSPLISDVPTLRLYLQAAHASKRSFDDDARHNLTAAMSAWAKNLATALDHLFVPYRALVKKCGLSLPNTNDPETPENMDNSKAEVVALARRMCSAYDILLNEHAASFTGDQVAQMKWKHTELSKVISRYYGNGRPPPDDSMEGRESEDDDDDDDDDDYVINPRKVVKYSKSRRPGYHKSNF
ncbi:hypothetical protein F4859DRAFT_58640 [Xylaria cf. heliscus]|nr:hypothetical protein F4859DRAFT_58640 [Xylaria cf. heliscus]